jgi:hypothetical protein
VGFFAIDTLVHGDCYPFSGHLEETLANLWVSRQVGDPHALASVSAPSTTS